MPFTTHFTTDLPAVDENVLIIDWGNTRIKIAVFDKITKEKLDFFEKKSLSLAFLDDLCIKFHIKSSILCSVVHNEPEIVDFLSKNTRFILVSDEIPLPITIKYSTPHTLGRDRIASVCGAWSLFPYQNSLVIDAGTCIKYDFVNANGEYLGGTISPGIGMRLRAMHEFTAKLPLVQRSKIDHFIGDSTETALRTGGQLGAAMEAQGFLNLYKKEFGDTINILITGGDGTYLVNHLENAIYKNDLILQGLLSLL